MKKTVVNLTPHSINVQDVEYIPSGVVARVTTIQTPCPCPLPGVTANRQIPGAIIGLPAPQNGVILLVSLMVLAALAGSGRTDVFAPDTGPDSVIRDANGRIIGVQALVGL